MERNIIGSDAANGVSAVKAPCGVWTRSACELKKLRVIIFCGIMGAFSIVLSFVGTVRIGPYMRIGVSEIPGRMVDFLFGPVVGGIFGGTMDLVKYLVNPEGAYFPGFTLSPVAASVIFGLFLYQKKVTWRRVLIPEILVKVFVNCGLNTLWLDLLYGKGFLALLPARILSNAVQLPIDTILVFLVLEAAERAGKKLRWEP